MTKRKKVVTYTCCGFSFNVTYSMNDLKNWVLEDVTMVGRNCHLENPICCPGCGVEAPKRKVSK